VGYRKSFALFVIKKVKISYESDLRKNSFIILVLARMRGNQFLFFAGSSIFWCKQFGEWLSNT
jgi:hypothetical protein